MDKIGQWWDTVSGASNHGHIEQAWRTQSVGLVTMDTFGKRGGQSVGPVTMDRMDTDTGAMPSPETYTPDSQTRVQGHCRLLKHGHRDTPDSQTRVQGHCRLLKHGHRDTPDSQTRVQGHCRLLKHDSQSKMAD